MLFFSFMLCYDYYVGSLKRSDEKEGSMDRQLNRYVPDREMFLLKRICWACLLIFLACLCGHVLWLLHFKDIAALILDLIGVGVSMIWVWSAYRMRKLGSLIFVRHVAFRLSE